MLVLTFTGPYGEGTEILREMLFCSSVPHLVELMAVLEAKFLTYRILEAGHLGECDGNPIQEQGRFLKTSYTEGGSPRRLCDARA